MINKTQYDQKIVNDSLANTFDIEPTTTIEKIKTKGKRGGARPGGGRKKGVSQKLSALTLLAAIEHKDKPFAEGLAEDYHAARMGEDKHLVQKYQNMILNKVVADKQELDVTTLGQSLHNNFTFPSVELSDWQQVLPSVISTK